VGGFGPGPAPDSLGPRIFLAAAKGRRIGRLTGSVSDPAGVRRLEVALRARRKGAGCRWWSRRAGRLARKRVKCTKPGFMKATLKRAGGDVSKWTLKLGARLPKGRYVLAVRATDRLGNVSTALASGRRTLRIGR
jgi:hypothetical protein